MRWAFLFPEKGKVLPVSFLSLGVYFLVSCVEFMEAAEKESCLSCWPSVADVEARNLVVAFLKRVHILKFVRLNT